MVKYQGQDQQQGKLIKVWVTVIFLFNELLNLYLIPMLLIEISPICNTTNFPLKNALQPITLKYAAPFIILYKSLLLFQLIYITRGTRSMTFYLRNLAEFNFNLNAFLVHHL